SPPLWISFAPGVVPYYFVALGSRSAEKRVSSCVGPQNTRGSTSFAGLQSRDSQFGTWGVFHEEIPLRLRRADSAGGGREPCRPAAHSAPGASAGRLQLERLLHRRKFQHRHWPVEDDLRWVRGHQRPQPGGLRGWWTDWLQLAIRTELAVRRRRRHRLARA